MSKIKELRKEFERKKKELQERCKHVNSTWCKEEWAIAHNTGYMVRVCDNCEKGLERITNEEYKMLEKKELIQKCKS